MVCIVAFGQYYYGTFCKGTLHVYSNVVDGIVTVIFCAVVQPKLALVRDHIITDFLLLQLSFQQCCLMTVHSDSITQSVSHGVGPVVVQPERSILISPDHV